jgi:hypothetical protein
MMANSNNLTIFITGREAVCDDCGDALGRDAWIMLTEEKQALCLACADLEHLLFLPAGDAALTRRSRKYSRLSAVVVKWNRRRKRYERQGLLVEAEGLGRRCLLAGTTVSAEVDKTPSPPSSADSGADRCWFAVAFCLVLGLSLSHFVWFKGGGVTALRPLWVAKILRFLFDGRGRIGPCLAALERNGRNGPI